MSIRIMTWVWDHSQAAGTALLVLLALADAANDEGVCWPSISTVAAKTRISESTARRQIQALVKQGELSIESIAGQSNRYRIERDTPRTGATPGDMTPLSNGAPTPVIAMTPTPVTAVTPEPSRTVSEEPSELSSDGSLPGLGAPPGAKVDPLAGFDEWYNTYPRHVGRGAARTKYEVAVRKGRATPEQLLAAAAEFARRCKGTETQYIPHPATWLSQERWADDDRHAARRSGAAAGNGEHWRAGGGFFGGVR